MKTSFSLASEFLEEVTRHVNRITVAARTFVNDLGGSCLALIVNVDGLATVAILDDSGRESNHVLLTAVIGSSARAGVRHGRCNIVEGSITRECAGLTICSS